MCRGATYLGSSRVEPPSPVVLKVLISQKWLPLRTVDCRRCPGHPARPPRCMLSCKKRARRTWLGRALSSFEWRLGLWQDTTTDDFGQPRITTCTTTGVAYISWTMYAKSNRRLCVVIKRKGTTTKTMTGRRRRRQWQGDDDDDDEGCSGDTLQVAVAREWESCAQNPEWINKVSPSRRGD